MKVNLNYGESFWNVSINIAMGEGATRRYILLNHYSKIGVCIECLCLSLWFGRKTELKHFQLIQSNIKFSILRVLTHLNVSSSVK